MKELFRKLLGITNSQEEQKRSAGFSTDEEKRHKHEIPSKEISERFGRAIERLNDR